MSVIKYTFLLLVLLATAIFAQDCGLSLLQEQQSTYSEDGVTYSIYEVRIKNNGDNAVTNVELLAEVPVEKYWELEVAEDVFTLPSAKDTIAAGAYHQFGYITAGTPVAFTVSSCDVEEAEEEAEKEEVDGSVRKTRGRGNDYGWKSGKSGKGGKGGKSKDPTASPTRRPATADPTRKPSTASPSRRPSSAATNRPVTVSPTNKPATASPTNKPATASPTDKPATASPTNKPATASPTGKPATASPTNKPATAAPTAAPTTKAATANPNSPTSSAAYGTKICPAGTWWQPAPGTTWQWVISTTPDTSLDVQMYDIDLFSATATTIKKLHDSGRAVICYFSTQYENWRPDAKNFPSAALGNNLDDWAGERWVDIRNEGIKSVMTARLDLAVSKGCDGVEPDNVDGHSASTGFPLTANDQLTYNKFLASEAHKRGLSIGLKNDLSQVAALQPFFDWALNEECYQYSECARIKPFTDANKAVFSCEYSGSGSTICPYMNNLKFSGLIKEHLDNTIKAQCCTYQDGGCAKKASYRCVSA